MAQINYSGAEVENLLDITDGTFYTTQGTNAQYQYVIFGRVKKNSSGTVAHAQMLVSNYGSVTTGKRGLCLLETHNRSGAFMFNVSIIVAHSSGTVTFGYYDDGTYYYLGVYRSFNNGGQARIIMLRNTSGSWPIEIGEYARTTTQPTGWTAATVS